MILFLRLGRLHTIGQHLFAQPEIKHLLACFMQLFAKTWWIYLSKKRGGSHSPFILQ